MFFYDTVVTEYELCLAVAGVSDMFPVEVRMKSARAGEPHTSFYSRIGQAVVDYLNDGTLLGVEQRLDASPVQVQQFQAHLPTAEEKDFLDQFLGEVATAKDTTMAVLFALDDIYDALPCTLKLHVEERDDGTLYPAIRYKFERVFDLFLFECYELLKERRLKKCRQCGRYFFPGKSKALFCSDTCRSQSHSVNSSVEYKAYRDANNTKNKQLNRGQISHSAYSDWQERAKKAMQSYSDGGITWDDYLRVLKQDLRGK